jgi:hypothetical protein
MELKEADVMALSVSVHKHTIPKQNNGSKETQKQGVSLMSNKTALHLRE